SICGARVGTSAPSLFDTFCLARFGRMTRRWKSETLMPASSSTTCLYWSKFVVAVARASVGPSVGVGDAMVGEADADGEADGVPLTDTAGDADAATLAVGATVGDGVACAVSVAHAAAVGSSGNVGVGLPIGAGANCCA